MIRYPNEVERSLGFPQFYGARNERNKKFRKAGRKYEQKKWKGRQELAETGSRIPVQGYLCTESQ